SGGATGVTRLTIFAGTTSTAAVGAARGAGGSAEPAPVAGAAATLAGFSGARAAGSGAAECPDPASPASMVRPENELSGRREPSVGGALIGALSAMVGWRGASPTGAP